MKLHLSTGEITLKSLSVKQFREAAKMDEEAYRNLLMDLYGLGRDEVETMPSREWFLLAQATSRYSAGLPLAEIKNLCAGDDGPSTPTETPTAPTAGA